MPVVDIANDHGIGERNRAEDHDHEGHHQRIERPTVRVRGKREQRHLAGDDDEVERFQRHAIDQRADDHLRKRPADVDQRQQNAEHGWIRGDSDKALAQELAVAVGREIEQQARRDRAHGNDREDLRKQRRGKRLLSQRAPRRRRGFVGSDARERDPARERDQRRHGERGTPASVLDQEARRDRRQRDAEVTGEPVHADGEARALCAAHQHRDADRMVDRRERAHQRHRRGELPRALRERDQQHRRAHAEEEDQHHPSAAPVVAQPSRGQRSQAEQREGADAIGHQVLPARNAEIGGDGADRGREDQQEHVVERMRDVEQQRRLAVGHGSSPARRRKSSATDCGISMPASIARSASASRR